MKNILQRLTCLMVCFLTIGCGNVTPSESSNDPTSSGEPTSSSAGDGHNWDTKWSYDATNHWHACKDKDCEETKDFGEHDFGEWQNVSQSSLTGADKYAFANVTKKKTCKTCGYYVLDGTNILPEFRFKSNVASEISFATTATKSDLSRPEIGGTVTLTNCPDQYKKNGMSATMKVRGNQTAGWAKKAFRVKFSSKTNLLGLNEGQKFKKWVLLADAKDTTLSRSALGFYIAQGVCKDEDQVWVSEYTPVTVYLNDEYWGLYFLAEQKEVKEGRVQLEEPAEGYTGVDIGYCFELDHYADSAGSSDEASEMKKGVDGDPTFRMKYSPKMEQGRPSGPLATGQVNTYTLLSDITDGPTNAHVQADYTNVNQQGQLSNNSQKTSNSNQLSFIRARMEALYQVLYYAAIEKKAKEINDDNAVVDSTKTVQQVMAQHFDLDAWVDGYIINAVSVPPDLGYSSFYMSYDNTPSGDKKLRYDVPWDFDSNFGNRNNFYVNAQGDTYVENTYNTWLYLLSKLSFFIDMVKVKWNKLRTEQLFENMFHMVREYYTTYDAEIQRNHYKWPQNDAAHQPPNNFDEIRSPYKEPSQYKQAEEETINWCAKRINFLESKWGTGRANINTNA